MLYLLFSLTPAMNHADYKDKSNESDIEILKYHVFYGLHSAKNMIF